jgi:hypothetical protein
MHSPGKERGLTISGFIFVTAVVIACVMIGFRVLPAYVEYYSVVKTLKQTLSNAREGVSPAEFRRSFDLLSSADYIDSVKGSDVDLQKDGNEWVATAAWEKRLPLVANVSLLLDFEASARK